MPAESWPCGATITTTSGRIPHWAIGVQQKRAGRLSNLRAPRPARLPNPKPTTINPKDSRYERGTNGGQVTSCGLACGVQYLVGQPSRQFGHVVEGGAVASHAGSCRAQLDDEVAHLGLRHRCFHHVPAGPAWPRVVAEDLAPALGYQGD